MAGVMSAGPGKACDARPECFKQILTLLALRVTGLFANPHLRANLPADVDGVFAVSLTDVENGLARPVPSNATAS